MAVKQSVTYQGIENNLTRPGSQSRTSALGNMAEDQAHLYEATFNKAVPDAASQVATGHRHDGALGALMRTPLATFQLDALLDPVAPSRTGTSTGWSAIVRTPFFVPEGITEVSLVYVSSAEGAVYFPDTVRAYCQNTSFTDLEEPVAPVRRDTQHYLHVNRSGVSCFESRLQVSEGSVNVLIVEAWEGKSVPSANDDDIGPRMIFGDRIINTLLVLPVDQAPIRSLEWREPTVSSTKAAVASELTSFDGELFQDGLGVSSYHLVRMIQNDGLLWEGVTGRPAGSRSVAQRTHEGHNHADSASTSLDDGGDEIDMALGAWSYGTNRQFGAGDTFRGSFDQVNTPDITPGDFTGRIFMLSNNPAKFTASREVVRHTFRLPRLQAASIADGTGLVRVAALVYSDAGVRIQLSIQVHDTDESNSGTAETLTMGTGSDEFQVLTAVIDCDVAGAGSGLVDGDALLITVDMLVDDGAGGAPGSEAGVCGLCCYFLGSP